MPSPIVFVDFDGVLHPESPCYAHRLFERADALGEVLRDHQAWAVLSTSWRVNHDMRQLQRQMGTLLGERVVGVNPQIDDLDRRALPDKLQGFPRHMECVAYLRAQDAHLDHWVALDDRPYWFYPLRGPKTRSLQVRDTRGLLHRDAKRNIVNHRATPASLPI